MKSVVTAIGIGLALCGLLFGVIFMMCSTDTALARFFNPLNEEVRRRTFETSRAYREGLAQEIQSMQFEYLRATPEQKDALASVILHRTAGVELSWLPQDVQQFVIQLRSQRSFSP